MARPADLKTDSEARHICEPLVIKCAQLYHLGSKTETKQESNEQDGPDSPYCFLSTMTMVKEDKKVESIKALNPDNVMSE